MRNSLLFAACAVVFTFTAVVVARFIPLHGNGSLPVMHAELAISHNSVRDMAHASDMIVIGQVVGTAGLTNIARDPNNPSIADTNVQVMAEGTKIKVQRYLKGSGPNEIVVYQPAVFVTPSRTKFQYESYKQMGTGTTTLLFLQQTPHSEGDFLVGAGEPWRFTLSAGVAKVTTQFPHLAKLFGDQPEANVVAQAVEAIGQ